MKKWKELKSDERTAVIIAQKLINKENATIAELEKMMKVEEFLESRGINSYDYNLKERKNYNEYQPETLREFLK